MNTVKIDSKNTLMIAHKGVSGIERENTCPAFIAAGNRSYYGIETDVHVTSDGKFIIIHDETVKRVSDGRYDFDVEKNPFSSTENIVLADIDGSLIRTDIRIPALAEYIHICKKYEKKAVLEVKNHFEEEHLYRMLDEIKATGYIENVIFISFDAANCVNIKKAHPECTVQFLYYGKDGFPEDKIQFLVDNKLDLDIFYKLLNAELIDRLHSLGIRINCWTCDNKEEAEELVRLGVDYITTNILE